MCENTDFPLTWNRRLSFSHSRFPSQLQSKGLSPHRLQPREVLPPQENFFKLLLQLRQIPLSLPHRRRSSVLRRVPAISSLVSSTSVSGTVVSLDAVVSAWKCIK